MHKIKNIFDSSFLSQPLVLTLIPFLLGAGIFLPTVSYDFVWDDNILFTPKILGLSNLPRLLISRVPIPNEYESFQYRPLAMFTYAIEYVFYKGNPQGYHFSNALFHGINSSLTAYLALLLFKNPYAALVSGALFALHPVHSEAVAFLGGRVDILATLFSLLALIAVVKKTKNRRDWGSLVLAPTFFFLAILSKETAVVVIIPLAIFLYQKIQPEFKKLPAMVLKIIPFGLVLILYAFLRHHAVSTNSLSQLKLTISPFFLFEQFLRYQLFLIFPPQRASYFFEVPQPYPYFYPLDLRFLIAVISTFLLLIGTFFIIYRKRETMPYFMLLILPALPPLLYSIYIPHIAIDRYLYLPTLGLALLAGWSFLQVPDKSKKWAGLFISLILLVYMGTTLWRTPLWKNEETLFKALKKEYPASTHLRYQLGRVYVKQNRLFEAYEELTSGLRLNPSDREINHGLGILYLQMGLAKEARQQFFQVLKTAPDKPLVLEGVGISYMMEGNYDMALEYLNLALSIWPQEKSILEVKAQVLALKQAAK